MPQCVTHGWLRVMAGAVCLLALGGCDEGKVPAGRAGRMGPPSFWVWHRSSELKDAESDGLEQAQVEKLYWEVADCHWKDGGWSFKRIAKPRVTAPGIRIIPVFRIEPQTAFLGSAESASRFAGITRRWLGDAPVPDEIQLDFDCPDRLLDHYARFLTKFGKEFSSTEISVTALASWPGHPGFGKLAAAVDSFAPMFYDLAVDAAQDVTAGRFQSLAAPAVKSYIDRWSRCPKPWFAGLPNYERLSVFSGDGALIGHVRDWRDESLFFCPQLKRGETACGTTVFTPIEAFDLSGTAVTPGMKVVHRTPDAVELGRLLEAAGHAGASGVIWFALPGPGMRAAFSVPHLTNPNASLKLDLRVADDGTLVLKNSGLKDLPPGAWELVIRADGPGAFRSAGPGAFAELVLPGGLPPEVVDSLVLRFARLPAGESMVSGPLLVRDDGLIWRIGGVTDETPVLLRKSAR